MSTFFVIIVSLIILQRLIELAIAKNNEKYMYSLGGYEVGAEHYKYIVILHTTFFISLISEVYFSQRSMPGWWKITFSIFVFAQVLRGWCLASLGRFWNTKIIVLPAAEVVRKGPYKLLRHPNYLVVITELLVLPLTFGAFYTAIIMSAVNALLLTIRIRTEEKALAGICEYDEIMRYIPRFIPVKRQKIE